MISTNKLIVNNIQNTKLKVVSDVKTMKNYGFYAHTFTVMHPGIGQRKQIYVTAVYSSREQTIDVTKYSTIKVIGALIGDAFIVYEIKKEVEPEPKKCEPIEYGNIFKGIDKSKFRLPEYYNETNEPKKYANYYDDSRKRGGIGLLVEYIENVTVNQKPNGEFIHTFDCRTYGSENPSKHYFSVSYVSKNDESEFIKSKYDLCIIGNFSDDYKTTFKAEELQTYSS